MTTLRRRLRCVAAALLTLASATAADATPFDQALAAERARPVAPRIDRDRFLTKIAVDSVTIAPDGGHVAWLRTITEQQSLWLQPTIGGGPRRVMQRADADQIFWSRDSKWLFLVSPRSVRMLSIAGEAWSGIIATLDAPGRLRFAGIDPWQPASVILQEERRVEGRRDPIGYRLWRIGRGGKRDLIAFGTRRIVDFAIGPDGRAAFVKLVEGDHHVIVARNPDGRFRVLARCVRLERCNLAGTSADGRDLFLTGDIGGNRRTVLRIGADGRRTQLHEDPARQADVDALAIDRSTGLPAIAAYRGGLPAVYGLTDETRHGLALLARLLPGQNQTIETSRGPWLVREQDARLQGSRWHLFDPHAGTIRTLIDDPDMRQRIPAAALAAAIAFTYTASDGMPIHGLLSVPVGRDPAHVPLVALVHGGPWSHDMPGYSAQVQLLTNRGFAVFRPQFRGSTGYGRAYMFAAKGDFGDGRVQRDIEDGVRYLLARGVGDAQRVGIVGASFGGYSTLQGLSNGSKLFRVGVAVVPPSDFGWASRQMAKRNTIGDAQGIPFVQSLRLFGMDERDPAIARRLFVQSPAARFAAMNTPLLILAAGRDDRVAIRGVIDYAARLKAANKPVRMVIARNQPHAAEDPLARRASLFLIEDMLSRHLGGRPAAPPAPDLAQWMAANMAMH